MRDGVGMSRPNESGDDERLLAVRLRHFPAASAAHYYFFIFVKN
jgi:hypothetical protein